MRASSAPVRRIVRLCSSASRTSKPNMCKGRSLRMMWAMHWLRLSAGKRSLTMRLRLRQTANVPSRGFENHLPRRQAKQPTTEPTLFPAVSGEIDDPSFPARTPVRAKPDGLTPVALRANRPLIAPSRPSSSRLRKRSWGVGRGPTNKAKLPSLQASKLPYLLLAQESGAREGARPCARR